jgi:multidrug efflux pump subunit AcrA (membrane-fusion protein)
MDKASQSRKMHGIMREIGKGLGVAALLVVLMMWLAGAFAAKVEPSPPQPRSKPPKFNVQKVERRTFPLIIEQVGNVRSGTEAEVSSRIMAQVKEILVQERESVIGNDRKEDKPTIMARLDDRDIQNRLRQAQAQVKAMDRAMEAARAKLGAARAQLEAAKANKVKVLSDYRRYQELHRSQAATGQQLESARAQKDIAEAQELTVLKEIQAAQSDMERIRAQKEDALAAEAEARVMLSYTEIQAPFTGRVVKKMVDVGDMAAPGQPLFLLEATSRPELHAFVSDSLLARLRVGQDVEVSIDALNRKVRGTVHEIRPMSDPVTRTVLVKVALAPAPDLVNGLFGRLKIPHGEYETLVVPSRAVKEVGQLYLVEVVDSEGYPQRRFVTIGQRHDNLIEVLSGLKENEEVVIP